MIFFQKKSVFDKKWRGRHVSRRRKAFLLALPIMAMASGCSQAPRPLTDSEKIVRSVLAVLAQDDQPVCLDDRTEGQALSVFREMTVAPSPSRVTLRWHSPRPLRPPARLSPGDLRETELGNESLEIPEPAPRQDDLPNLDQMRLTSAARYQSRGVGVLEETVAIRQSWAPKQAAAHWWLQNRFNGSCRPRFLISNPVRTRTMAFVSVRAEHWGTLYALERTPQTEWRVVAEWSRWLY